MKVNINDIPVKVDAPGAVARVLPDFGAAFGVMAAEHYSMAAGTDLAPLLRGLRHDACHAAHWGYVLTGEVIVNYTDGTAETCSTGDLFHWMAGHSIRVESDTELILFSPQSEHTPVIEHIAGQLANAG